jgi:hypothetical protein
MIPYDDNKSVRELQGLPFAHWQNGKKLAVELYFSSQTSPESQYEMHAATGDAKAASLATAERVRRAKPRFWHLNASFDPC